MVANKATMSESRIAEATAGAWTTATLGRACTAEGSTRANPEAATMSRPCSLTTKRRNESVDSGAREALNGADQYKTGG